MVLIAPVWSSQSWYPWLLGMLAYPPALLPVYRNLLHDPFNRDHPLLVIVKGQLQLAAWKVSGVPAHSLEFRRELQISSQQDGKEGQTRWVKWNGWCDARCLNPLWCSVQHFVDSLTELFDSGLQHDTTNVVRSAVSMTHETVEGVPISQHPLVRRLMKGVYNPRLPKPRYTYAWERHCDSVYSGDG